MINVLRQKGESLLGFLLVLAIWLGSIAAWLTHIITCFNEEQWGYLIAGALVFPIAVIHGIGIWMGVW